MPAEKSVHITYFVHGTTTDNAKGVSSGWNDVELSEKGKEQQKELIYQIRAQGKKFDVVYCSDLRRAVESAEITFGKNGLNIPIVKDRRLREINYGDMAGSKSEIIDEEMSNHIDKPFPNGQCYEDVEKLVRSLCEELKNMYEGKHVAIVDSRACQLAFEVICNKKTWEQAMREDWRIGGKWQPGWEYILKE